MRRYESGKKSQLDKGKEPAGKDAATGEHTVRVFAPDTHALFCSLVPFGANRT